ncbi:MAG: thioredoxin domain-containing protein [Acidobacteriota bacterium]|nr:thioredoxin domain-containing protein [Acidobacteriota bacterium]
MRIANSVLVAGLSLFGASCAPPGTAAGMEVLPGAEPRTGQLADRLRAALAARGPGWEPRTEHLAADGSPRFVNRLILESSPYLLQHAHNPVDWYPWGDEAFAAARRLDRPVFLSIGYSTCHWCHVMERESFEDLEVARFLNEHYVAIKVDREERPDVDSVYMSAVQMMTGQGGWPMSVWLTADREPFFGGTYFPARDGDRGVAVGFLTILARVETAWEASREEVAVAGQRLAAAIRRHLQPAPGEPLRGGAAPPGGDDGSALPGVALVDRVAKLFHDRFDPENGGTRGAPKFPSTVPLRLLMRHYARTADPASLAMVVTTLEKMAAGGIYDQVGGGFHRYATDARWLVPHFEKMLYDNALLAVVYTEAFQLTGEPEFERTARGVLDYVGREMTSPDGGFYSATDADSPGPEGDGEEGLFFTWTPGELAAALGPDSARVVASYFDVRAAGNFEGRSILHRPKPLAAVAEGLGLPAGRVEETVAAALPLLYAARATREPPLRDDKILTAWNGLMISGFALAARTFADDRYLERAERAAGFAWSRLRAGGRLARSYREGRASNPAVLEDYAFLAAGYLDLYEAGHDARWLDRARELQATLDARYPAPGGGYYRTADDAPALLARERPAVDGALPSGNSVAALVLQRLGELTGDDAYRETADGLLASLAARLEEAPAGLTDLLLALEFRHARVQEVVLVAPSEAAAQPFLERMRRRFAPHQVLIVAEEARLPELEKALPLLAGKTARDGKTTAYVCEQRVCQLPTTDVDEFAAQLLSKAEPSGAGAEP